MDAFRGNKEGMRWNGTRRRRGRGRTEPAPVPPEKGNFAHLRSGLLSSPPPRQHLYFSSSSFSQRPDYLLSSAVQIKPPLPLQAAPPAQFARNLSPGLISRPLPHTQRVFFRLMPSLWGRRIAGGGIWSLGRHGISLKGEEAGQFPPFS